MVFSSQGFRFYINFIDAATNFNWVFPLSHKSHVHNVFLKFQRSVELQCGRKIKALQMDNALEFKCLTTYLELCGIEHRFSCPYSRHRHLVNTAQNFGTSLSWLVYNRNPSCNLGDKAPIEKLFATPPEYSVLRIFGSKCFPCLQDYRQGKLDGKSLPFVFLGYPVNYAGYICYDLVRRRSYISRDVRFIEHDFYLSELLYSRDRTTSGDFTTVGPPPVVVDHENSKLGVHSN